METNERVVRLEERVEAMRKVVTDIQLDQKAQNAKLDILIGIENQRRGARVIGRYLLGLVTSGGFIGWCWEHFHK